jgi:hypothetical protein
MRIQRLFGVVIAVLLGTSLLHQSPSAPHAVQSANHRNDHRLDVGNRLGGTGIQLASAALPAGGPVTPLALGEVSPIGLLRPVKDDATFGAIHLASATVPVSDPGGLAEGDDHPVGLLRPAGTRFVKLVYAWMSYQAAHPPPPPPPAPAPVVVAKPALVKPVVATPVPVVHHVAPVPPRAPPVAPATAAAGGSAGGVWAELRDCESGGKYAEDTGNGYYGAYQFYQFSPGTWHGLGYPGLPSNATPAVQDQAAQRLQARSGWGQWPGCSRKLGLL